MMDADQEEAQEVQLDVGRLQSLVVAAAAAAEQVLGACEAAIDRAYGRDDDEDGGGGGSGGNGQPSGPGGLTSGQGNTPPLSTIPARAFSAPVAPLA